MKSDLLKEAQERCKVMESEVAAIFVEVEIRKKREESAKFSAGIMGVICVVSASCILFSSGGVERISTALCIGGGIGMMALLFLALHENHKITGLLVVAEMKASDYRVWLKDTFPS
jgi:ribosomal protein S27E